MHFQWFLKDFQSFSYFLNDFQYFSYIFNDSHSISSFFECYKDFLWMFNIFLQFSCFVFFLKTKICFRKCIPSSKWNSELSFRCRSVLFRVTPLSFRCRSAVVPLSFRVRSVAFRFHKIKKTRLSFKIKKKHHMCMFVLMFSKNV